MSAGGWLDASTDAELRAHGLRPRQVLVALEADLEGAVVSVVRGEEHRADAAVFDWSPVVGQPSAPTLLIDDAALRRIRTVSGLDPAPMHVRSCAICGCTDERACPGGCGWATDDLCSRCAPVALTGECHHYWLDRPESDTHECLVCGLEASGPPPRPGSALDAPQGLEVVLFRAPP